MRFLDRGFPAYHTWRQTDTAQIALNFYKHGMHILHPEVSWAGDEPNYVAAEFQLFPYIVALVYHVTGPDERVGLGISVLAYAITSMIMYLLLSPLIGKAGALGATYTFAILPIGIAFTRTFQPESMMLTFSILSLYFWSRWCMGESHGWAVIGSIATALAALLKLPNLYLGVPIGFLVIKRFGIRFWREPIVYVSIFLTLAPVVAWWGYCYDFPIAFSPFWQSGHDKWGTLKVWGSGSFRDLWTRDLGKGMVQPSGFIFFFLGWWVINKRNAHLLIGWILGVVLFIFALGQALIDQDYYRLPVVPACSVMIGAGVGWLWSRGNGTFSSLGGKSLCVFLLCWMLSESWNSAQPYYSRWQRGGLDEAVRFAGKYTGDEDIVLWISTWGHPELFYFSERRGWKLWPWYGEDLLPSTFLSRTRRDVFALFTTGSREELDDLLANNRHGQDARRFGFLERGELNAIYSIRSDYPLPLATDLDSVQMTFSRGLEFDSNGVMLVGTVLHTGQPSPPILRSGTNVGIDTYWQWRQDVPEEMEVEYQLWGEGALILNHKHVLLQGRQPMTGVEKGSTYVDRVYLPIPWEAREGPAEMRVQVCGTAGGTCLQVVGGKGSYSGLIGEVMIQNFFRTPVAQRFP